MNQSITFNFCKILRRIYFISPPMSSQYIIRVVENSSVHEINLVLIIVKSRITRITDDRPYTVCLRCVPAIRTQNVKRRR